MGKVVKLEFDINSIVEFDLSEKERLELVNHILYSCTTAKELKKFTRTFIEGIRDTEGDNVSKSAKDVEVFKACNVLLLALK